MRENRKQGSERGVEHNPSRFGLKKEYKNPEPRDLFKLGNHKILHGKHRCRYIGRNLRTIEKLVQISPLTLLNGR